MLLIAPECFPHGNVPWPLEPNESNLAVTSTDVMRQEMANDPGVGRLAMVFARTQSGRIYQSRVSRALADDSGRVSVSP